MLNCPASGIPPVASETNPDRWTRRRNGPERYCGYDEEQGTLARNPFDKRKET
jgi:hypothetical protein